MAEDSKNNETEINNETGKRPEQEIKKKSFSYETLSGEFAEKTEADWIKSDPQKRKRFIDSIFSHYNHILTEFLEQAKLCTKKYKDSWKLYLRWRKIVIWCTGLMPALNIIVAYTVGMKEKPGFWIYFSIMVAIYATILAIFTNLENFHNYSSKAQQYLELRDEFLDARREFERIWHINVFPYAGEAKACVFAAISFNKICERDRRIRKKAEEICDLSRQDN